MKEFWVCNSRNVFCIVGTQHWRFCFSPTLKATEVWWWVNVPCFCFCFFTFYTGTDGLVFLFCFCFKGRLKPLSAPSKADFFFFLSLHWSRHILTVSKPAGERRYGRLHTAWLFKSRTSSQEVRLVMTKLGYDVIFCCRSLRVVSVISILLDISGCLSSEMAEESHSV